MTPRAALLALAAALAGFSPFEREEENVRAGNEALAAGTPAEALRRYDDAERAAGRHAEIDLDRGNAHLAGGRGAEAAAAWRRAAETGPPALASRALQNLGTALAASGDRDGAARAFADALGQDPSNEDARWNLEVLLRQGSRGRGAPRDPGGARREERAGEARTAPGTAAGEEPERERPAVAPRGTEGEPERRAEAQGSPGAERRAGERREPLSRQDAEALLDALRSRERNMPLFGRGERENRRRDAAKDW